jgi:hypothetical protein
MWMSKLKMAAVVLLTLGAAGAGTAGLAYRAPAVPREARQQAVPPGPAGRAPAGKDQEKAARERLEEQVRALNAEKAAREQLEEQVRALNDALKKLQVEVEVQRRLAKELERKRREIDGVLQKVDIGNNTVSLTLGETKLALEAVPLSADAKFFLGDKECGINDLKVGMAASLQMATEKGKSLVVLIRARAGKKE